MKIIKLNPNNPYCEYYYDALDNLFNFMGEYLPWIYLKKVRFDGETLQLPRWITKRHMDSIDKEVQDLMNNLNWK